jgi:hypothetical protein
MPVPDAAHIAVASAKPRLIQARMFGSSTLAKLLDNDTNPEICRAARRAAANAGLRREGGGPMSIG